MANPPTTPYVPDTPLYKLVAEKLGRDPIAYIRERRAAGVAFARITDEIKHETDVYLTHEAPRRWLRSADAADSPDTQALPDVA